MRTNIMLDKRSYEAMKELPRKVSASAILRHMLKAIVTNDKEWDEYIQNNEEGKAVRAYIHENTPLLKRLKK